MKYHIHLLNAAVMQQPGRYTMYKMSPETFYKAVRREATRLVSHIGYQANIDLIEKECKVRVNLLRARDPQPRILDGDHMLIMRLKRRDSIPAELSASDFEYFQCEYNE